ncbi:glycosyltransferase family 2 protein [Brevundimonas sp.]|uniref:glycosyltransferase family 2 protein n=1 Tax=Brevundimonas sp. TaxID=1871086 RepID=UPI0039199C46
MTQRLPLSAFVICLNEAGTIEACIRSLDQCAEIVIVDSGSTDSTAEVIERLTREGFPIRFMHQDWLGFARQKQFALEQATQHWLLSIDADERLDQDLRGALPGLLAAPDEVVGWRLRRRPWLMGYGYTPKGVGDGANLRLFRRGKAVFDIKKTVHEGLIPDGTVRVAEQGALLHYRPLTVGDVVVKEERYATLKAGMRAAGKKRFTPWRMLLNPPVYFLRVMYGRKLYRAGWAGVIFAMQAAIYSFLTEAKTWEHDAMTRHPSVDRDPDVGSRVQEP